MAIAKGQGVLSIDRNDEAGSISPLIVFFFVMLLLLTFLVANVAAVYIARRELTSKVEYALSSAVREIDEFRYYYGNPLTEFLAQRAIEQGDLKVPVDCGEAKSRFLQELKSFEFHESYSKPAISMGTGNIELMNFRCNGYELIARVSEEEALPFQFQVFGIKSFTNIVEVGSASIYQRTN